MAVVSEVVTVGNLILGYAQTIQNVGGNWYKAGAELSQFRGQVEQLQVHVEFWAKEARNRGLSSDPTLMKCLNDARSLLKDEQENLEKRANSCGSRCFRRIKMTAFPATLGLSIEAVTNAFKNIPETLRLQEEAVDTLERARMRMPVSESISSDSRYVPLKISEAQVCDALNNSKGPAVVLLYGSAGTGKSTLARKMVAHYNNEAKGKFEHILFLDCGPQAEAEDTLFEIIQRLGSKYVTEANPKDEKRNRPVRLRQQVKGRLADQNILIVLDDVSNKGFLENIVKLCGHAVKCLITSQDPTLWRLDPAKCLALKIQAIDEEAARKMLAAYVGLATKHIPKCVQDVADKMLAYIDGNPLAIASMANAIDKGRADELNEWEKASTNLSIRLSLKSEVPGALFEAPYSKSFWVTVKQTIDALSIDARRLLVLTDACEGTSVPEEIVEVLYMSAKFQCGSSIFSNARSELESRQLIKISSSPARDHTSPKDLSKYRTWSVHSLHKLYITEEMGELKDDMFKSLAKEGIDATTALENGVIDISTGNVEDTMVTTLCALYLNTELGNKAASKMGIVHYMFSKLRRNAIEPITLLLGRTVSHRWTQAARDSAINVFLSFICNGVFYDEGIANLLQLPSAAGAMWKALKDVTFITNSRGDEEKTQVCVVDESTPSLMKVLVEKLNSEQVECDTEPVSHQVISNLVFYNNKQNLLFMVRWPGFLDGLMTSLSSDNHPSLQKYAGSILINLCSSLHANTREKIGLEIVNHEGIMVQLANLLSKDTNPTLQQKAAWALSNLVHFASDQILLKVLNFPGFAVVEGLARLLRQTERPRSTHEKVTSVFYHLTMTEDSSSRMKLREVVGLMERLVCLMLDPTQSPWTQYHAAFTVTLLDATQGNHQRSQSARAYLGRAEANSQLRMSNSKTMRDYDRAHELDPKDGEILRQRCVLKANMGELKGAMEDMNQTFECEFPENSLQFYLQERGVLKRMMGDFPGALADLDQGLILETDDYERLKHRAFVKFLMNDAEGARTDAEWALRIKTSRVDNSWYSSRSSIVLGYKSVEFLGYKLK